MSDQRIDLKRLRADWEQVAASDWTYEADIGEATVLALVEAVEAAHEAVADAGADDWIGPGYVAPLREKLAKFSFGTDA